DGLPHSGQARLGLSGVTVARGAVIGPQIGWSCSKANTRSARSRSAPGSRQPVEMHLVAVGAEQANRLVEWQADNVGVGADELHHEGPGQALDGVAASLAPPFARGEVAFELIAADAFETHARLDQALAYLARRRDQADAGVDAMR